MGDRLFPERIETERLRLERLCRENLPPLELYEHANADAPAIDEVTWYVTWEPHRTPKESRDFLVRTEETWDEGEGAAYVIRSKEADAAGEFVGTGGLDLDWDRRSAELGVWLRKEFWGRGYSGERAGALLDVAFDRLDLEAVTVCHHVENRKSRRAIERYVEAYGGEREGTFRNVLAFADGTAVDADRYAITREGWREKTR
ncbi:GNAT family N-acetyltransferase [Halegenticoccus tardaugens]|uniref:GNAT family N-acetyltransferase n=1 Tax=Halegenticoccus tardaugens TaxID=2071624 RepID=UPI00100A67A4|nr:GNAT family protein [Halegenticoccus tardaugens]